jgi:hypothetical protein
MRRQAHGLFGRFLIGAGHFEQEPSRSDHGYPVVRGALTAALPGFGRFLGDRFVRENTYPNVTAAAYMTGDCPPGRLNLTGGYPGRFHRLQAVIAENYRVARGSVAPAVPFMSLAVLDPLRL